MANATRADVLPESTEVLVVGGGPVGTFAALAFARYGYKVVVLEKYPSRLGQPKAHVINSRTAEIFRQYGLDTPSLRKQGPDPEDVRQIRFVTSLKGVEFGQITTRKNEDAASATPEPMFNMPQPILEAELLKKALNTGAVTYLRSHDWQGCVESAQGKEIISTIRLRDKGTQVSIKSKYLIGCDGTNATSRDVLQIPFRTLDGGPERVLHYASVHFSADLSHIKPALLWFVLDPANSGVMICYNRKESWVFTIQYDPLVVPKEKFSSQFMKEAVFQALGERPSDYKDLGITLWKTVPKVAQYYRSQSIHNAFISGDAAHSFPPTGGLGVNTGIADVHNLVWKISATDRGWAAGNFLDSVTTERCQVAKANSTQSKINEDKIFRLVSTIFTAGATAEELMANETSRQHIRELIDDNYDHFDALNLDLGYVYGRGATRGPSDYQRECVPGARLPHEWITNRDGARISTLDLVEGFQFVLIASPGFTTDTTLDVKGIPVSVLELDRDFSDPQKKWAGLMGLTQSAGVLVRPDQHILGSVQTMQEVAPLLLAFTQVA